MIGYELIVHGAESKIRNHLTYKMVLLRISKIPRFQFNRNRLAITAEDFIQTDNQAITVEVLIRQKSGHNNYRRVHQTETRASH